MRPKFNLSMKYHIYHLKGHFQAASSLCCKKRDLMQNLSDENEFDLHENKPANGPHFHINGFEQIKDS